MRQKANRLMSIADLRDDDVVLRNSLMPRNRHYQHSTAVRKGPRAFASTCVSSVGHSGMSMSVDLIEMEAQQEPMVLGHRGREAPRGTPRWDAFARGWARLASLAGLVSPAIIASIMARPLLPIKSESTESNLILASSSVFCTRCTWLDFSRTNCLRVRSRLRISWVLRIRHEACPDQTVRQEVRLATSHR